MKKSPAKYLFAHEESDVNFLSILLNQRAFAHPIFKAYLEMPNFHDHWLVFTKGSERWFCNARMFNQVSDEVIRQITANRKFSHKLITRSQVVGRRLYDECYRARAEVRKNNLVAARWSKIFELFYQLCALGLGAVMSDLEQHRFSQQLDAIVNDKITRYKLKRSLGEYISILINSPLPTYTLTAKKALLTLGPDAKELNNYIDRYGWLNYGHRGPALTMAALKKQLQRLSKNRAETKALRTAVNTRALIVLQSKYSRELRLSPAEKRLFATARDFNGIKAYRIDLMSLTFYTLNLAINVLARQQGVPVKDLYNLTPQEFLAALRSNKLPALTLLKSRYKKSVSHTQTFDKVKILVGPRADKFLQANLPKAKSQASVTIIRGFVASEGQATGQVKIVRRAADIYKVKTGDILVAAQTIPQYLPAMMRAVAFVTDIGGITSHAAIVARELKKPCVIGTKIATQVLRDGDRVEVDAEKGVVRKVK